MWSSERRRSLHAAFGLGRDDTQGAGMIKRARRGSRIKGHPQCVFLATDERQRSQSLERLHEGEPLSTACGGNLERGEIKRKGVSSTVWSHDL